MIQKLREFLDNAHSVYHGVAQLEKQLLSEGYTALKESENWDLTPGGKSDLTRGGSAILAFRLPAGAP